VGIATGYGLDCRGSIPGRGNIFLSSITSRPALGPTQPPIQSVPGALSSSVTGQGREADHLPPSSAEVKNGGAILYSPIRHGMVLNYLSTRTTLAFLLLFSSSTITNAAYSFGHTAPVTSMIELSQSS
jgi:hypothetical protein